MFDLGPPSLAITSIQTISGYVYLRWKLYNGGSGPVFYQISRSIINNGIITNNFIIACMNVTSNYCRTIVVGFIVNYCVRAVRNHDILTTACVLRYDALSEGIINL